MSAWLTSRDVAGAAEARDLIISAASGFLAGCVSAAVTNPMDVIKTRMQTLNLAPSGGGGERKGTGPSLAESCKALYKSEGWKGFTRGMGARVLQIAPVSVMTISTYEIVKYLSVKDP
ncbi:hypothetical protein HDU67_000343 [Dinochytrium kinnereticum]|nr:hypothetical protein HDU67_000343 [Dinochytrium kinnereticum]